MNETYVEINLDNLSHNLKAIKNKYNDYDYYIPVLKGDAYGHGEYIVKEIEKNEINYVAVATLEEALNVRKYSKIINILLLEPIDIKYLKTIIKNNLTLTVHRLDYLKVLINILKDNLKIHIKIDTGLGRLGFTKKEDLKECVDLINESKYIELEGIYSHFATIGIFDKKWDKQVENFKNITSLIDVNSIPIRHMGSSITLLNHPKIDFCNGIRFGTIMYGYNISYKIDNRGLKNKLRLIRNRLNQKKYNISKSIINVNIDLIPCMNYYTSLLDIKLINKNNSIGYGATVYLDKDTYIGVIPIGYNNGLGTSSRGGFVIINQKKYRILSIGMNMTFIELDKNVNVNNRVVILDNNKITIGTLSRFFNRTFHEVLLNIGKNNKRVYIKDNKIEYIEDR